MEARNCDPKDPLIIFDLLTVRASDSFHREVDPDRRRLDGWEALLSGLRHVARERAHDARVAEAVGAQIEGGVSPISDAAPTARLHEGLTERELRAHLANLYHKQQAATVSEIVKAKLLDNLSLFAGLRLPSLDHALGKWSWYIYCLSIETDAFLRPQKPMLVNVPLDTVDLCAIADLFNVQIVVTRMFEDALRFSPQGPGRPSGCCHLLLHSGQHVLSGFGGLWAALLDVRSPECEPVPLDNAIVEVDEVPPGLTGAADRAVYIRRFDKELNCYIATCGDTDFPVQRSSIKRILLTEANLEGGVGMEAERPQWGIGSQARTSLEERADGDSAPALEIPEGSLEFQVLHELVRRSARQRLQRLLQELAGRNTAAASASAPAAGGSAAGTSSAAPLSAAPAPRGSGAERQQSQQWQGQPKPVAQEHAASYQRHPQAQQADGQPAWMTFEDAQARLTRQGAIRLQCLIAFTPDASSEAYLPLTANEWVQVDEMQQSGDTLMAHGKQVAPSKRQGWVPTSHLIGWRADDDVEPHSERFLRLRKGDVVLVESSYDAQSGWAGWGHGRLLHSADSSGVVPLDNKRMSRWAYGY